LSPPQTLPQWAGEPPPRTLPHSIGACAQIQNLDPPLMGLNGWLVSTHLGTKRLDVE